MSYAICFDFDGVLYSYTSGFLGVDALPDPPVEGAAAMCRELRDRGFDLCVLSARGNNDRGRDAISRWLAGNGFPAMPVVATKPKASLYVDDRGFRFTGDCAAVLAFAGTPGRTPEPWNKKNRRDEAATGDPVAPTGTAS